MVHNVTYKVITLGLRELPLGKNPVILVHSSLKSFGYVEEGAQTVIIVEVEKKT